MSFVLDSSVALAWALPKENRYDLVFGHHRITTIDLHTNP